MKDKSEWDPSLEETTKEIMDQRILSIISNRGWQNTVRIIKQKGIPFEKLKIAEIGCGTGTFSLTFCLMGASVTLIDNNQKVLENTKRIYGFYDCEAKFLKTNCLEDPPEDFRSAYDFAASYGLAEHFLSKNREKCIMYHKNLLKKGGFACIGVPNSFSPFYRCNRLIRELTGTWRISLEIPFSCAELNNLAKKSAFNRFYIIGSLPLSKDFLVYSRGFVSVIVEMLPGLMRRNLRGFKTKVSKSIHRTQNTYSRQYLSKYLLSKAQEVDCNLEKKPLDIMTDRFSSGLILFGFV